MRKFVAIMVSDNARTKFSSIFVALTALGKTGGPGLGAAFQFIPNFDAGPIFWRYYNAFSYIAILIWSSYLIVVIIVFEDCTELAKIQLTKIRLETMKMSKS